MSREVEVDDVAAGRLEAAAGRAPGRPNRWKSKRS